MKQTAAEPSKGAGPLGSTLGHGRYVVAAALGQGSQAKTYEAVDKLKGRPVALKVFHVAHAESWKEVELAEREARVLAALQHPLLPAYVDHFEEGGALCLVMEKVEGTSVADLIEAGKLSRDDVVRFLHDAAAVLSYLHHRSPPVIHRDIKPNNVIRRPDGHFSFVDFGSVRQKLQLDGGSTVVGTFGFMAPEQFQARALPATDVYAVGATAMMMLTGTRPEELPHQGLNLDVEAALGSTVEPSLKHVLQRMLESDPDRRTSDLQRLLAEKGIRADYAPDERAERASQPRSSAGSSRSEADSGNSEARWHPSWAEPEDVDDLNEALAYLAYVPPPFSFVLRVLIVVVLSALRLAIGLAFQLIVPLVLAILSVMFGSGLRRQASGMRASSEQINAHIQDISRQLRRALSAQRSPAPSERRNSAQRRHERDQRARQAKVRREQRKRYRVNWESVDVDGHEVEADEVVDNDTDKVIRETK